MQKEKKKKDESLKKRTVPNIPWEEWEKLEYPGKTL